jgi:hypothetical protein
MTRGMFSPMKMQVPLVSGLGSGRQAKARSRAFRARSAIFAAGALLGLITLGGCGGGGGGSYVSGAAVPFVYPTSLSGATSSDTVNGFMSPYALTNTTPPSLVSVDTTVFGASPSNGIISIAIGDITDKISHAVIEPGFVVNFDSTSSGALLSTSPLDSVGCQHCLVTASATANYLATNLPAGTVTFTYIDPASSIFSLRYSTLGMWSKPNMSTTTSSTWPEVGGAFSAGVLTRGVDLPTIGSAQYEGYMIGRYATSDMTPTTPSLPPVGTYIVGANASATADFAARSVSFFTSNTHIAPESGGAILYEPRLDLTSTMTITGATSTTSNLVSGTVRTSDSINGFFPGTSGGQQISAGFYGPPDTTTAPFAPPELGGSLSVANSTGQSMVGSFALKKTSSTP